MAFSIKNFLLPLILATTVDFSPHGCQELTGYEDSPLVFAGLVKKMELTEDGVAVTFRNDTTYKSKKDMGDITLHTWQTVWGYEFELGGCYLVFISWEKDGKYFVDDCTHTTRLKGCPYDERTGEYAGYPSDSLVKEWHILDDRFDGWRFED